MDNSESYATILKFLRDRWATAVTIRELTEFYCEQYGAQQVTGLKDFSIRRDVESILIELNKLALVAINKDDAGDGSILSAQISKHFLDLQRALKFSLNELTARGRIRVQPIFQQPSRKTHDVFVAMPFTKDMDVVYECIKDCCSAVGLSVHRGDEDMGVHGIMHDIWSSLFHAHAVIADCTNKNPNVFYEIGIAHTLGKPVVLISRSAGDVPFDVNHLRAIIYQDGIDALRQRLTKTLANRAEEIRIAQR